MSSMLASVGLLLVVTACGDKGSSMQIVAPPELADARVLLHSEAVVVTSLYTAISDDKVRLRAPSTYAMFAEVEGDPVWAGRVRWQDTLVLPSLPT